MTVMKNQNQKVNQEVTYTSYSSLPLFTDEKTEYRKEQSDATNQGRPG